MLRCGTRQLGLFLLQEGLVAAVGGVVHFVFIGSFRAEGEEGLGEGLTGRRKANEHEVGRCSIFQRKNCEGEASRRRRIRRRGGAFY